jgi:DNA mismatch repair protein MutL
VEKIAPVKIRVLPDRVANQIAAGEVIERPAAAVKELVENALDAGATRIEVEFRSGGLELIRIEDNGHGMSRDDAILCLERHATSKLAETSDLDRLTSFGFRGEAVPSIASVAQFTLRTRTADAAAGTEIGVNAGVIGPIRECGRAVGTSIIVEHLFHPVPARRKFLKSEATESAHIVQVVRLYALAFPQVSFALRQDGREIFSSPRGQQLAERVRAIFGSELANDLVPIQAAESGWSVHGLIAKPGRGQAGRQSMVAYVNQRPVDSKTIAFALLESYRESLPKGRFPAAFLFLACDPAQVDVNVHPAKREVRFRKDNEIRSFLIRAILQRHRELSPLSIPPSPEALAAPQRAPWMGSVAAPAERSVFPAGERPQPAAVNEAPAAAAASFESWRYVGLAQNTYALFDTPSGLVLLDCRAAAERVFFERTLAQFEEQAVGSQHLLLPIPLELDPVAAAALLEALPFLNAHGFIVTEFGRHFFRLEGVPAWMDAAVAEPFLRDWLSALREGGTGLGEVALARRQLVTFALGRAAPMNLPGTEAETRRLLADLMNSHLPLTNPAGRPTLVELSANELNRRFGRA